jgi:tRNA(Arg) A34 adenosine deaminase TadA
MRMASCARRRIGPPLSSSLAIVISIPAIFVAEHHHELDWNRKINDSDPAAHAEVLTLREESAAIGKYCLEDRKLFATIEPCAACAVALLHDRNKRLGYGADDPKAGAVH